MRSFEALQKIPNEVIAGWPAERQAGLVETIRVLRHKLARSRFFLLFPDQDEVDPLTGDQLPARHRYPKHLAYFAAGVSYRERCAMCANRVGKTRSIGAYEVTAHLTGLYPPWWEGKRFRRAGDWWVANETIAQTRDITQEELLGKRKADADEPVGIGTGMIPHDLIVGRPTLKSGVADAIDAFRVRHVPTGGVAEVGFKSYDQGRSIFQGTAKQGIWCDEEPPPDVYGECVIRTMTTRGIVMCTFTPLKGLSQVALSFLPGGTVGADG